MSFLCHESPHLSTELDARHRNPSSLQGNGPALCLKMLAVHVRRCYGEDLASVAFPLADPCFVGQQPPLERVPDQVGLIAQAKLSHEIGAVALDGADADG